MRISFIIPYHNEPLCILKECINSILRIPIANDEKEIIVIDDGSKTSHIDQLKELHSDIIYLAQDNQGLSMARNTGLSIATGDYIQFVDSDDALIPDIYERVINEVREKRMDMLMFRFTNEGEKRKTKTKKLSRCYEGYEFLLNKNLRAAAWCYIFRKDVLGDLRFHPGIYHEDVLFTPQLIMRVKSLYVLKEKAYFYRQGEGTIMSNRNEKHIQKRLDDSLFVLLELQKQAKTMDGDRRKAMQRCIDQQTMCYLYTILQLRRPFRELRNRIVILRSYNLYPPPLKFYTMKYCVFALLSRFF